MDFVAGTLLHNGVQEKITLERNDLFRTMHNELMNYDLSYFPNGNEAFATLQLIDAAEKAAGRNMWIRNQ